MVFYCFFMIFYRISCENNSFSTKTICFYCFFIKKSDIFSFLLKQTNCFFEFLWYFIVFSWFSVEQIDFSLISYRISYKNNSCSTKTICFYWFFIKNLIFSVFLLKKLIISLHFDGILLFFHDFLSKNWYFLHFLW